MRSGTLSPVRALGVQAAMAIVAPPPQVETIIVTAPRLAPLGGEAVFATEQLDAEALKTAPRLDVALKRVPGVSLFRRTGSDAANPTIQGISLRGIAPSGAGRALVTLDGVPQNDPFGGWVIWSALPPEGLESVTLVRGAGAGAYGAGALTGVVALEARTDGASTLDISAGQRGSIRGVASLGAPSLWITVAGETTDGYRPVRGAVAGGADTATFLDAGSVSVGVSGSISDIATSVRVFGYQEQRGAGLRGAESTAQGAGANLGLVHLADGGGWRAQVWVRSSDLANSSVAVTAKRAGTTPAADQYSTPALGYGLSAAWQGRVDAWSWELGGDARFATGQAHERFRFLNGAFSRGRDSGGKTAVGGIYAEVVHDHGDLLLTGGARIDGWRQTGAVRRENDLATGLPTLNSSTPDSSGVTPTARFGARLRILDEAWLRAAAYAGFRPPTLNELHRPFRVANDITEANPYLLPEKLYGAELGLGGDGDLRWRSTLFFNQLDDPITNVTIGLGPGTFPVAGFVPAGGALRKRQNAGRIEAWGIEGQVSRDFDTLMLNAAFSATRARVDGGSAAPQLTGKRPAQAPQLTITAGARWQATERLGLSLDTRFESQRFEDDLNTRKLASALSLDARMAWKIGSDSEVYLAADNVSDAKIAVGQTGDGVVSYAAPRLVRIGFSLRR